MNPLAGSLAGLRGGKRGNVAKPLPTPSWLALISHSGEAQSRAERSGGGANP